MKLKNCIFRTVNDTSLFLKRFNSEKWIKNLKLELLNRRLNEANEGEFWQF